MPTVFVYEWCCAVGAGGSLGREGRAMRDAVADDFRRLPGVAVTTLDADARDDRERWNRLIAAADAVLVIAPESDNLLSGLCERVRSAGRTCLCSDPDALAAAGDKLLLHAVWTAAGVPTPRTVPLRRTDPVGLPVVLKPQDGAGSDGLLLATRGGDLRHWQSGRERMVCQPFVPGRAASITFLIGPAQTVPLLPAFQHLSDDGRFTYLGGELPIPPELAERAVALGRRAVGCVPGLRGYVGVDVVLGDAADGSADFAIEINPRLTTSYVGLRALAETNLAGAMLDVCVGRPVEVRRKPGRVRFTPDGTVQYDPNP
jgi:predicted ATP-grasp superfamily ATP-dependent carboligase